MMRPLVDAHTHTGSGISAVVGRKPLVPTETSVLWPRDFTLPAPDLTLACPSDLTLACAKDFELAVKRDWRGLVGDTAEGGRSEAATPSLLSMLPLEPMLSRWRSWAEMEGGLEGLSGSPSGTWRNGAGHKPTTP